MVLDADVQAHMDKLQAQTANANLQAAAAASERNYAQLSMFEQEKRDIAHEQLDISQELERIEHIIRGDRLVRDVSGNEMWVAPKKRIIVEGKEVEVVDTSLQPVNEKGVQIIMGIAIMYINKNTLLSCYDLDTINEKMNNLSTEIADIFLLKYREMGMDTPDKKKMQSILIREIVDAIHSTYLRALNGEERASIRKIMHISQIDNNPNLAPSMKMKNNNGLWSALTSKM